MSSSFFFNISSFFLNSSSFYFIKECFSFNFISFILNLIYEISKIYSMSGLFYWSALIIDSHNFQSSSLYLIGILSNLAAIIFYSQYHLWQNFSQFFARFSDVFAMSFDGFANFSRFLIVLGPDWTHSDPFGYIRMHSDAFGNVWHFREISQNFRFSNRCSTALNVFVAKINGKVKTKTKN